MTGSVSVTTPLGFVRRGTFRPGQTIAELYKEQGLSPSVPVICVVNGKPLLRKRERYRYVRGKRVKKLRDYKRWDLKRARQGDNIAFMCVLHGGGEGGKNILRTIALIALAVTAAFVVGPSGLALAGTALGTLGAGLVQAGLVVGGSFLLSAILPVTPAASDPTSAAAQSISPTYSINATGNQARLLQPIPRQYGKFKITPDFAAQAYANYHGNEQFVYELFSLGLGTYQQHEVRIGENIVWNEIDTYTGRYSSLELAFYEPGEVVDLFPTGVDVSGAVNGQELRAFSISNAMTFVSNTITMTPDPMTGVTYLGFEAGDRVLISSAGGNDGFYTVDRVDNAGQIVMTVVFPDPGGFTPLLELTPLSGYGVTGPYPACRPGRVINTVEVDFIFPAGLGVIDDDGDLSNATVNIEVDRRIISSTGEPLSTFALVGTYSYVNATHQPQRITEVITGFGGNRVEIRVRRTSDKAIIEKVLNTVVWGGMRGFFTDDDTYADVSLMAVKARVGSELSATASRAFSVLQTAKLPIWDGATWSAPTATRSIAWAAADLLRNSDYGMGLADAYIDLDQLLSLDATWAGRGDLFNGIFDTSQTAWDSLKSILAAGRSKPVLVGSIVSFVRDTPADVAKGVFTPRNMRKGSAEFTHILVDINTPDDVIVEYVNEVSWTLDEVQCSISGSLSLNPARITLFGVTNTAQATREGNFLAASNAYRRVFVSFASELEGKLLVSGDTILVAHDLVSWGQAGEVADWDGVDEITLSEPGNWVGGDNDYLILSTGVNREWGPVLVRQKSGTEDVAVVDAASRAAIEVGSGPLADVVQFNLADTQAAARYVLGVGTSSFKRCKLVGLTPQDMNSIQMVSVVDDPRVYVN